MKKMRTLYHGTSSVHLASIKAIGLVPGHAKGGDAWAKEHHWHLAEDAKKREPSVFVADDVMNASTFARYAVTEAGGDPIVLAVHVPEHEFAAFVADELFEDDGGVPHAWRAHSIDPAYVGEVLPAEKEDPMLELLHILADRLSEGDHRAA